MFDHVTIRASDRVASERFYTTVLASIGIEVEHSGPELPEWGDFSLAAATPGKPVTRRLHVGFGVGSHADVDRFWQTGVDAGYRDDGAPGPRTQYAPDYYGGFLLDPDGNSVEAVYMGDANVGGIDHLWIRVADVAAARDFYALVAPAAGIRLEHEEERLARFAVGERSSFSVLAGEPTEGLHMAFGTDRNAAVEEFHRIATAAGHRDDGAPRERLEYHAGYYGAFVLDPDGNSVEVVNHNR